MGCWTLISFVSQFVMADYASILVILRALVVASNFSTTAVILI